MSYYVYWCHIRVYWCHIWVLYCTGVIYGCTSDTYGYDYTVLVHIWVYWCHIWVCYNLYMTLKPGHIEGIGWYQSCHSCYIFSSWGLKIFFVLQSLYFLQVTYREEQSQYTKRNRAHSSGQGGTELTLVYRS